MSEVTRIESGEPNIVTTLEQVHQVLEHSRIGHLTNKHNKAMAILEGVQHFEKMVVNARCAIEKLKSVDLYNNKKWHEHNLEIYSMCIARLWQRYKKVVNQINTVNQYI